MRAYACQLCRKASHAPELSPLFLLLLCEPCRAKRYADGIESRRKADARRGS